jgi:hypothetical protein
MITPEKDGSSSVTRFTGNKIPDLPAAQDLSKIVYGKPVKLLNGKDLSGWKLLEPKKVNGWSIVDGALINNQPVLVCTGGAITPDEFIPGPLYLQGDSGKVSYRNIEIKPILKK